MNLVALAVARCQKTSMRTISHYCIQLKCKGKLQAVLCVGVESIHLRQIPQEASQPFSSGADQGGGELAAMIADLPDHIFPKFLRRDGRNDGMALDRRSGLLY